jgi:hypothetical protein
MSELCEGSGRAEREIADSAAVRWPSGVENEETSGRYLSPDHVPFRVWASAGGPSRVGRC